MSNNYEVAELTWENGQLAMHELGGVLPTAPAKPSWSGRLSSCDTLESIVHHATQCNKQLSHNHHSSPANRLEPSREDAGSMSKKRARSDSNWQHRGIQEDYQLVHAQVPSTCASASATFDRDNDTTMKSWASYDSLRSLKTAKTIDKDESAWNAASETQEEERETKGETGQSRTRGSRAAAVHNQSERRRRDRINQRMKTLQKLVPNASKTDKVSILDDVIMHLKQLQAQVQLMTMRSNMPQLVVPQALGMQQHHHHHHLQMSLLAAAAAAARMGVGSTGMSVAGGFVPPSPFMMPPVVAPAVYQANKESNGSPSMASIDPYTALLAQSANMDLYNKMAAAIYRQQSNQTTQPDSTTPSQSHHDQGDQSRS